MGRVILYAAVLLGAAYSVPAIRQRTEGPADRAWSRLAPYTRLITDPIRRDITLRDEKAIAKRLQDMRSEGRAVPSEDTFNQWLRDNISSGTDAWERPYYLSSNEDGSTWVGSVGSDGIRGTADDVQTRVEW